MNVGMVMSTVGGNVNWYSHYGEQYGGSLKILKIELPYDPDPFQRFFREKFCNRFQESSFDQLILLGDTILKKDMSLHCDLGFIFKVLTNFSHFEITFK